MLVASYTILSEDKNLFINHEQHHSKWCKPLPHMYIKLCTTYANPLDETFSWDTDGISFIIDESDTAVINNVRRLFTGSLTPTRVTMETADRISTHTKLFVSIKLVLMDDSNQNHVYIIRGCVYDSDSSLNMLGIPTLGKIFDYSADPDNVFGDDGTAVKTGATKSQLMWAHGKHEQYFLHGSSTRLLIPFWQEAKK